VIIDTVHCTEMGCDCGGRWWTGWIGPAEIHIVPIDDVRPHHFEACPCDPSIEMHIAGDGYASWLVSHDSFDRRELTEQW
jgi:hypothetical protein